MRKMKDSGIEWIGDIPEGWEISRLGLYTVKIGSGKTPLGGAAIYQSSGILFIRSQNIFNNKFNIEDVVFIAEDIDREMASTRVYYGDILLNITGASIGRSCIYDLNMRANVNQHVCIIRCKKDCINNVFVSCMIMSSIVQEYIKFIQNGANRDGLNFSQIRNIKIFVPPLSEQQRIADYLDAKCTHIDEAAELVRQSMEKLRAYKLSLITEAVTKGLDPDVPMKDSGILWIGEIPEGWEISRLGTYTIKIGSGKTPLGGAAIYQSSGVLFIRSQNVLNNKFNIEDAVFISEDTDREMSTTRVLYGDILLNITGASIGRSCVYSLNAKANVNQHVCIIRCKKSSVCNVFVNYLLMSNVVQEYIKFVQNGANREGLNFSQIRNIKIFVPPLSEQQRIADYLDAKCARIDALLEEKERLLERLAEYKKSLIFECVTGKRDVSA